MKCVYNQVDYQDKIKEPDHTVAEPQNRGKPKGFYILETNEFCSMPDEEFVMTRMLSWGSLTQLFLLKLHISS